MENPNDLIAPELVAQALKKAMEQANSLMGPQQAGLPPVNGTAPVPMMPSPQVQTQTGGVPNPTGWSVPVEADVNGMAVTVYVQFPPQTFPQFQQIIAAMMSMGYQVRAFQKNGGGYGGNGGGFNRGGYGGGYGGGFNRGGFGRRW